VFEKSECDTVRGDRRVSIFNNSFFKVSLSYEFSSELPGNHIHVASLRIFLTLEIDLYEKVLLSAIRVVYSCIKETVIQSHAKINPILFVITKVLNRFIVSFDHSNMLLEMKRLKDRNF